MSSPAPAVPGPDRCRKVAQRDEGASEVVGSILMVAITVALAAGLVTIVFGAVHGDEGTLRASMSGSIQQNANDWGTGDETVRVSHDGGRALPIDALAIVVEIQAEGTRYTETGPNVLEHAGQDAFSGVDREFTIGERWTSPELTVPPDTRVFVQVVDTSASSTVWSGSFRSGASDCATDTTPPTVSSWSQTPSDVTTSTTGDVTVGATLADTCGVDTTSDPHLHYRVNDGTNPAFTDAGAMSLQSGTTWQGTIPDQTWGDHGGETLEYKLVDMADEKGNTGESTVQQDVIEQVQSISYVQTPLGMVTGTATNDANARSADDGDAAATLTEASTGSSSTTEDRYGTTSSGNANNVVNAEGAPDDQYVQFQVQDEFAEVSGFPGGTGTITQVEIALEGRHDGNNDANQPDQINLSHDLGSTSQTYPLTTTDTQHFLDVTSDRSWTWTEIQSLGVRATCECHQVPADNRQFFIDALWVRVTTTETTYALETDAWTFDPLGGSSPHTLEIRYQAGGSETYQVQVWDGSTWTAQSPLLDQGSYTVFSETLTSAEVAGGPQIRIVDTGASQSTQDTLDLDYVRVVSS